MKQKPYSDEDNTRTDVNGAWKPLKPLQEGYEFIGDDQYDNFLTKKGKERRDVKKDLRQSGLSRKDARKQANVTIPNPFKKKLTDAQKYQQLKRQTESAGMSVKEVDGKIVVSRQKKKAK